MRKSQQAGGMPAPRVFSGLLADFTPPGPISLAELRCRGDLPHLYRENGSYFVTFRLWDAVESRGAGVSPADRPMGVSPAVPAAAGPQPAGRMPRGSRPSRKAGGTPAPRKKPTEKMSVAEIAALAEPPLTLGSCILARPELANLVQKSVRFFDGQRYSLAAWCVMPNHVHAVFTALGTHDPSDILHSWKSYTSHEMNKILRITGSRWERESFDHLIRSLEHFEAFVQYVENNPVAAGLCRLPEDWPYSSAFRGAGVPPALTAGEAIPTPMKKPTEPPAGAMPLANKQAAGTAAPRRQ